MGNQSAQMPKFCAKLGIKFHISEVFMQNLAQNRQKGVFYGGFSSEMLLNGG